MMHMTKCTFTRPLKHSEIVALAIRHWPMPCVVCIVTPHPMDQLCFGYSRNPPQFRNRRQKSNRARRRR